MFCDLRWKETDIRISALTFFKAMVAPRSGARLDAHGRALLAAGLFRPRSTHLNRALSTGNLNRAAYAFRW